MVSDSEVRPIQIVLGAMVAGLALFAAVAVAVGTQGDPGMTRTLALVLGAVAMGEIPAYVVVRGVLLGQVRAELREGRESRDEPMPLPPSIRTLAIIRGALAESVGLLGCVAFLVTREWAFLGAPGLASLVILFSIPTRHGVEELLDSMRRER